MAIRAPDGANKYYSNTLYYTKDKLNANVKRLCSFHPKRSNNVFLLAKNCAVEKGLKLSKLKKRLKEI